MAWEATCYVCACVGIRATLANVCSPPLLNAKHVRVCCLLCLGPRIAQNTPKRLSADLVAKYVLQEKDRAGSFDRLCKLAL